MKILQIINNLGSGGAEKIICDFAPLVKEKGHQVEVLLLRKQGSLYFEELERAGIQIICLNEKNLYSFKHIYKIWKYLRKNKFNIVHVHLFPAFYFVSLACLFGMGNTRLVYTKHSGFDKRMKSSLFRVIDNIIYKKYHKIITITEEGRELLYKYNSYFKNRKNMITVISNGIDVNKFKKANAVDLKTIYDSYNKEHKIITMIGRLVPQKGQDTLLRSIKLLPENVHLLLIGEGNLKNDYKELVIELSIEERVHFLGLRTDVPNILKASDIGVLSSNWEPFGLAAVEVMAAGKPVVVSDVAGLNSIVRGAGLLFSRGDKEELSSQISMLLNNEDFYDKIVNLCIERANKYDIHFMVDKYIFIYQQLVKDHPNESM